MNYRSLTFVSLELIFYLIMETLRIDIINPKARKIIEELADLNLITIKVEDPITSFQQLLTKLRRKHAEISLDEITKEVEGVRSSRHSKKS
jgi:hypothetical protein